jgi:hypothetical protein
MKSLLMFVRLAFVVQLVLGIGFWTGHFADFVMIHQALGIAFVLGLWIIAFVALRAGAPKGPAIALLVLGIIIAGFGSSQVKILVGDMHWIVRVVHLVLAMAAMPLAERLGRTSGDVAPR